MFFYFNITNEYDLCNRAAVLYCTQAEPLHAIIRRAELLRGESPEIVSVPFQPGAVASPWARA